MLGIAPYGKVQYFKWDMDYDEGYQYRKYDDLDLGEDRPWCPHDGSDVRINFMQMGAHGGTH